MPPVPIATPSYTLGEWMGNVTDDAGVDWIVTGEAGWSSSAPVRANSEPREGADGGWPEPSFFDPRVVTLTGRCAAPNRVEAGHAKERLKAALPMRGTTPLIVREGHLTRKADVRTSDIVRIRDIGSRQFEWQLTVRADDHRKYGLNPITDEVPLTGVSTYGRTQPRTFAVSYTTEVGPPPTQAEIFNPGTSDTPAVITFFATSEPSVEHLELGRTLGFDIPLGKDDRLDVDLATGSVRLNGTGNRRNTLAVGSRWFLLQPRSQNTLAFRGTPAAGGNPRMAVITYPAWR